MIVALDTATTRAVVALGDDDGNLVDHASWDAGHRHAEELLPQLDGLLARNGRGRGDLRTATIAVGTGPGAFTGLRVGLATAKALARAFDARLVGIPTGAALLRAAGPDASFLLLPAGPADLHVVTPDGHAAFVPGGIGAPEGDGVVAVDLSARAPEAASARGERARAGFAATLVAMAAERRAAGQTDDPALLVPEYVTLPRGLRGPVEAEVAWLPTPR
jgi:tRNA threonylcarbamoyladenosine biosynthesis protein TsaB